MLAALRLGIAYVNIDTASPATRNGHILSTSGARALFVDDPQHLPAMQDLAATAGITAPLLSEAGLQPVTAADLLQQAAAMAEVDGACIAYIMFTSGSTGVPKGVAVTHQNVLHFIQWGIERFGVGHSDNFANLSPMYFDNSVFDFYVALFSGASLTPVHRKLLNAPAALVAHVAAMRCTIWFSVPSLLIYVATMKVLTATSLPAVRCIIFGGEGYPKVELIKLYRMFGSQARLVNVYGPTECTCICSAHDLSDADFEDLTGLPTLGRLNPNFDHLILDDDGLAADEGELCLIGPNVASGYFNDPQRSAAAFLTLTDPGRFMKRMYRTGDLVRRRSGRLHFVGRKDNQIKHMGYRIELEEIEHGLGRLPGVDPGRGRLPPDRNRVRQAHWLRVEQSEPLDEATARCVSLPCRFRITWCPVVSSSPIACRSTRTVRSIGRTSLLSWWSRLNDHPRRGRAVRVLPAAD